jgi:hypothetical protein
MGTPTFQIGNIPSPYEAKKIIIDYRNLPICVDHIEDTGTLRKRYVYYHNYGDHVDIFIVTIPFKGKPKVKKYTYTTGERHRLPKSDARQYIS